MLMTLIGMKRQRKKEQIMIKLKNNKKYQVTIQQIQKVQPIKVFLIIHNNLLVLKIVVIRQIKLKIYLKTKKIKNDYQLSIK
jgi:hypothetical protein